jgi:hypothetical protein
MRRPPAPSLTLLMAKMWGVMTPNRAGNHRNTGEASSHQSGQEAATHQCMPVTYVDCQRGATARLGLTAYVLSSGEVKARRYPGQ